MLKTNFAVVDANNINEALVNFFSTDPASPFKGYNLKGDGAKNYFRTLSMIAQYLFINLNFGIGNSFLSTVDIDKRDLVFRLLKDLNYIPLLKSPATAYLRFKYYRCNTNDTKLSLNVAPTGITPNMIITGSVSGKQMEVLHIDNTLKRIFCRPITGVIKINDTISDGVNSYKVINSEINKDYFADDDNKDFFFNFTEAVYNDTMNILPTFSTDIIDYTTSSFLVDNKNIFSLSLYPYIENNKRYLACDIPVFQGNWFAKELTNLNDIINGSQKLYFTLDGKPNIDSIYKDKVIKESIKIFVKKYGTTTWVEFTEVTNNADNNSLNHYKLGYDENYGMYAEFDIDHFCDTLNVNDELRFVFAYTYGDVANTQTGNIAFNPTSSTMDKIRYFQIVEGETNILYETEESNIPSIGSNTYVENSLTKEAIDFLLIDENETNTYFNNGLDVQSIESMQKVAPIITATLGRAVNDDDWKGILNKRFTQYKNLNQWSGANEFIDMQKAIDYEVDKNGLPLNVDQMRNAFSRINLSVVKHPVLAVGDVYYEDLVEGRHKRDVGFSYVSILGSNFNFITNTTELNRVKSYMDNFRMPNIYTKIMNPVYILAKLMMVIRLKKSYTVNASNLKTRIYNLINTKTYGFTKPLNMNDIISDIREFPEIDDVENINWTFDAKVKNESSLDSFGEVNYNYIRLYNKLNGEINQVINGRTLRSEAGQIFIDNTETGTITSPYWTIDYETGCLRFNYDFGVSSFYIRNINFRIVRSKILSFKETVIGVENVNDINVVLV